MVNLRSSSERKTPQYPFHTRPWRVMDEGISLRKAGTIGEPIQGPCFPTQQGVRISADLELLFSIPFIPSLNESSLLLSCLYSPMLPWGQ